MILLPIILTTQAASANPAFEDLRALEQSIADEHGAVVKPIDRRLRLTKCPEAVTMTSPRSDQVLVACPSLGWKIPVQLVSSPFSIDGHQIIVEKGELVQLSAHGSGFSVSRSAVALQSGAIGTFIRVRISDGQQTMLARITGVGKVAVGQ